MSASLFDFVSNGLYLLMHFTPRLGKLMSELNIVGSQPKVEKALENKVKTPETAR